MRRAEASATLFCRVQSHVRAADRDPNRNTEVFAGAAPRAVDLRQAYAFARGVAELQPGVGRAGHRLVWVRGASWAAKKLEASEGAFAVVGRHTHCQISIADDPFVALRHVLVRSLPLPSGGVALRIVDLHTGTGFFLADGSRQTSILAEGPVVFSVGEIAFVALPDGTPLPPELPRVEHEGSVQVRDQLAALDRAMSPYRANARPDYRSSRITSLPLPVVVGEVLPPSLGRLTGGRYSLTLARGGAEATVTLSDEDLVRGVVIGRSEKCHSEALREITEMGTSRVHLLVIREGLFINAYDLASTQGTFLGAVRTSRARLPNHGSVMLILGNTAQAVRLAWRAD